MGLSALLARWSAGGSTCCPSRHPERSWCGSRWSARSRARGWALAASPADADLLVVCGRPDDALAEPVATAFGQLPGPRARVDWPAPTSTPGAERGVTACWTPARRPGTPPGAPPPARTTAATTGQ